MLLKILSKGVLLFNIKEANQELSHISSRHKTWSQTFQFDWVGRLKPNKACNGALYSWYCVPTLEYKYNTTWIQIKYNLKQIQYDLKQIQYDLKPSTACNWAFYSWYCVPPLEYTAVSFSGGYSIFPKKKRKFSKWYWHNNETNSITFL